MKELLNYLESKSINYKKINDLVVGIDGKTYELAVPDEDGIIFDSDFCLLVDDLTQEDRYVFKFGENWYWTEAGTEDSPVLNPVLYLGKSNEDIETDYFLGVRGAYEILNGSRVYQDWINKAKFLGVKALGICEKNTLAGTLKFQNTCKSNGIKPIIGATYVVYRSVDREQLNYHVKCYAKNKIGWHNLLMINKEVKVKNNNIIKEEDFLKLTEGLVIVLDTKTIAFDKVFPIDLSIEDLYYSFDTVEFKDNDKDKWMLENLKAFYNSEFKPLPISDAFYLEKEHAHIKVKLNKISNVHEHISFNQYFKSKEDYFLELSELFNSESESIYNFLEKLLENEKNVVKSCNFEIETNERYLPKYEMTEEELKLYKDSDDMLLQLAYQGLEEMIPEEKWDEYAERIESEFQVIKYGDVVDYFLIVRDVINWSIKNGILVGIGRGSAGGSLLGYLIGVHYVDPIEHGLLFERFLNKGRIGKRIEDEKIIIHTDEGVKEIWHDKKVDIERNGRQSTISAKNLKAGDKILSF